MMRSIKRVIRYFLVIIPVTSFYLMCFLYETTLLFKQQGLNQHPESGSSSSSNQLEGKFDLAASSSLARNHRMLMNNEYIASTEGSLRHPNYPSVNLQHSLFKKHLRSINLPVQSDGLISLQQISYGRRLGKQGHHKSPQNNGPSASVNEFHLGEDEAKGASSPLAQPIRLVLKKFKPATVSMSDLSAFYTPVPDSILLDLTDFAFIKNASDTCVTGTSDEDASGTAKVQRNHNGYNANSSPSSPASSYLWSTVPSSSRPDLSRVKSNEEEAAAAVGGATSASASASASVAPFLLAFVHSAPSNFDRRKIIRQTWAHPSTLASLNVKVVFILGLSLDASINSLVDSEASKYSDLVQGNFVDSYKNLTYKHLAGYKWVMRFCNSSSFIMKVDDDAFVDVFKVVSTLKYMFLSDYGNSLIAIRPAGILACSVFPEGTPVKRNGKWALSHSEYPMTTYPEYCSGVGYFASTDVLFKLFNTAHEKTANGSLKNKAIWIDDLFVTGTLAQVAQQKHLPMNFQFAYDHRRLRNWLARKDSKSNSYLIADIGDVSDWQGLMTALWDKTKQQMAA